MSSLPSVAPRKPILLKPEFLTPTSFAPFGTAIHSPIPQHLRSYPNLASPPTPLHPNEQPNPQPANQNTALKTSPISPLINDYPKSSPENNHREGTGLMSIFSCFPRRNTYLDPATKKLRLRLEILERHPYTSQTFCPFNFSSRNGNAPATAPHKTYFLIIVAPTRTDRSATPVNPPDLTRLRAFLAPVTADGGLGMAVTYAPGTWHAPMVVVGERRVDFLVSQFVNGVPDDDCQEVLVGKGIEVDLGGLGVGEGSEEEMRLWRAKL